VGAHGERWEAVLAVAGLMLAMFLVALDQTVVATAMPKIIADLEGFEHYPWVTTAYLLASTAMIPVVGKLGDIYGRKWFIVGGIALFLVGSALCGLAWGMIELIFFRVIQGLGAGLIFANVFTSIADIFPDPARRAKYQGIFFGVFALSSVVGPALGGWLTDTLNWRWVFYINLPLGIVSLFALPLVLPEGGLRRRVKIDYVGAATITTAVIALLLALSWVGQGYAWDAGRVVVGLIAAAILLAAFVFVETRVSEPVIPLSLFKSRTIAASSALMFLLGFGMFGIILYAPLFVQGVLGQTATGSGTVLTPLVLTMTALGVIGGQLMGRTKRVKPFMIVGTVVSAFGVYLMTTLGVDSGSDTVALFLAVTGFGLGLIQPTSTLVVQTVVEKGILGVATSATQFVRQVGATVGAAVVGSIVTKGYAENLAENAPPQTPGSVLQMLSDPQALVSEEARQTLSQVASTFTGGDQIVSGVLQAAREALAGSIHEGFVFTFVVVAAAVVATLLVEDIRLEDSHGHPAREQQRRGKRSEVVQTG